MDNIDSLLGGYQSNKSNAVCKFCRVYRTDRRHGQEDSSWALSSFESAMPRSLATRVRRTHGTAALEAGGASWEIISGVLSAPQPAQEPVTPTSFPRPSCSWDEPDPCRCSPTAVCLERSGSERTVCISRGRLLQQGSLSPLAHMCSPCAAEPTSPLHQDEVASLLLYLIIVAVTTQRLQRQVERGCFNVFVAVLAELVVHAEIRGASISMQERWCMKHKGARSFQRYVRYTSTQGVHYQSLFASGRDPHSLEFSSCRYAVRYLKMEYCKSPSKCETDSELKWSGSLMLGSWIGFGVM